MKMKIITVFLMCFVMINITACNGESNEMERRREEQGSDTQLNGTVKDAFINAATETDNETNNDTKDMVGDINSNIKVELGKPDQSEEEISLKDADVYTLKEQFQITLKPGEDDTPKQYCIVNLSLLMDKNHPDYDKYKNIDSNQVRLIRSEVASVIGNYTYKEFVGKEEQIKDEILERIQNLYGSDFIYKISFDSLSFIVMKASEK